MIYQYQLMVYIFLHNSHHSPPVLSESTKGIIQGDIPCKYPVFDGGG